MTPWVLYIGVFSARNAKMLPEWGFELEFGIFNQVFPRK